MHVATDRALPQASIEDVASMITSAYRSMSAPDVKLTYHISPDVPRSVPLDTLRVRQVLANGVTNALKNTKSGCVVLQVMADRMNSCICMC